MRNGLAEANPGLCTGGPDVQHRLKFRRIVQRRKTDGHESRRSFAAREEGRAAIGAEAASREGAAAGADRERFRGTRDLYVRYVTNEAGSERRATGTLAVAAVAVERRHWRGRTYIADRSACTTTGKRGSHMDCCLWPSPNN